MDVYFLVKSLLFPDRAFFCVFEKWRRFRLPPIMKTIKNNIKFSSREI